MRFSKKKMFVKGGVAAAAVCVILFSADYLGIEKLGEAEATSIVTLVVFVIACFKNWWKNR